MIGSTTRQSSLFYVPLARQAVLLKDDLLDPVDALLDDPELVSLVRQKLASRRPLSPRTGRPCIAPDRLLRCCVLKHLKGWSFRELEREVRSNLVYRRFTHFDDDPTPDYSSLSRRLGMPIGSLGPTRARCIERLRRILAGLAAPRAGIRKPPTPTSPVGGPHPPDREIRRSHGSTTERTENEATAVG